jgi:hypothetical protein
VRSSPPNAGVALAAGALAISVALGGADPVPAAGSEHDAAPAAVEVRRGADGASVRLAAATRERMGLRTVRLAATELPEVARGFGHVLDPAALAAPVYEHEAARAAFEAAEREYRRVGTLQRGNANASERDLEAARVAFERDRAALRTSEARLLSVWGRQAAARGDLPGLVEALVARGAAVARIDLPPGVTLQRDPSTARLTALADAGARPLEATLLGPAPDTDATIQGRGFLLLVERAPWPPGTALAGWLGPSAAPERGVDVPGAALVRHAGQRWVYVEADEGSFVRRAVRLRQPTENGWFVSDGLAAGEAVVVVGAQQLLSAELGGAGEQD